MNTLIASYYISELDRWKEAIELHFEEITETDDWLREVQRLNTVPKLDAKVEHHLNLIMLCRQDFDDLKDDIESLEKKLSKDSIPLEKEKLSEDLQTQQNEIRSRVYKAEQQLLEVKFECNTFLAETMNAQK